MKQKKSPKIDWTKFKKLIIFGKRNKKDIETNIQKFILNI